MRRMALAACVLFTVSLCALAQQPVVAIHVSELTQALEATPASGGTPTGPGTTGKQWWTPWWHYFVMSETVKEALRSDGTPFVVVTDADITAGNLLTVNGTPRYPIVISLASEAIRDDEIAPLRDYVSSGGFLFAGSSSFTRNPDGSTRGDFAISDVLGLHMANPIPQSWYQNTSFSKTFEHRIVSHIPDGTLTWNMPLTSDDISWSGAIGELGPPGHVVEPYHYVWQVVKGDALVLAQTDNQLPYITTKTYGHGTVIYDSAMEPLMGNGGWAPGMYAYGIFRKAIEWAFESANLPIIRLSPWPYKYNAAFVVRHDFEDFQAAIDGIESSAQTDNSFGAKGDYYFCTGTLRVEMGNSPTTIAGLQRAVTLYGATIGSHNGGLSNPADSSLIPSDYDYWHWGPDEILDVQPPGFATGSAYAATSIGNSLQDISGWLAGINTNTRTFVSPYFTATREASYQILDQLGIITAGEQKLTPFPHWTVSTQTQGKRFRVLTLPVSDWFIGSSLAQSLENGHTTDSIDALVDSYYGSGALVNLYTHELSGNPNPTEYLRHSAAEPNIWAANAVGIYNWWINRSSAIITPTYAISNGQFIATASISGSTDSTTAVEFAIPNWVTISNSLQVKLNGVLANASSYRIYHQGIKVNVGTNVSNVQVIYTLVPTATDDSYTVNTSTFSLSAPGVLGNDKNPGGAVLTPTLVSAPSHGTLTFSPDGSFSYVPTSGFAGIDSFTYQATAAGATSNTATVTLMVLPPNGQLLFLDNFSEPAGPDPLWTTVLGSWNVQGGMMQGSSAQQTYGAVYTPGNWANYAVQAQIQFPAGGFGGGIDGRLNPATGARYGVWIYPEGSGGGSSVMKLIKFEGWTQWSFTPMATANLPSVGTAWHNVAISFVQNTIQVTYDGIQYINVADNGFDSVPAYLSGAVSLDMWTYVTPYVMNVDNVLVQVFPPAATNDGYEIAENTSLSVSAPGVLSNDSNSGSGVLTAALVSNPSQGTLALNSDGSFAYSPVSGFIGTDSFTYKASVGGVISAPATATIVVNAPNVFFSDNFAFTGTDPLWTTVLGTSTVGNGVMRATSSVNNYGVAYVNGNWSSYSVQAQVQFPTGGFGGGIDGLVNSATGSRYAVWIYPEGSAGGSAVMKLIKFGGWAQWSGTPMVQATLPSVGAAAHTVLISFQGNSIQAWYDGVRYVNVVDSGFDSKPAYTVGGIGIDMYTYPSGYTMNVSSVTVQALPSVPSAQDDSYGTAENTGLSVPASGVLGNDTISGPGALTAILASNSSHGTLVFNGDGSFIYTPVNGFFGLDTFTYRAVVGSATSSLATVTIAVPRTGSQLVFSDSFSRSGSDPLWITGLGTWTSNNGVMQGTSSVNNYGLTFVNSIWSGYTLQAQIQFPTGGFGGGIDGLMNPSTGARYSLWIYPEGSVGGSAVMKLIKFSGWTQWSGNPMAQAKLPSVGTNWHTVMLTFQGSTIQVSYDGVQYINAADNGFDARPAYTSGGIGLDMYTYPSTYTMNIDNVIVMTP